MRRKIKIVSVKRNFCCNCKRFHEVLVWICKDNSFVCDITNYESKNCYYYECDGCISCSVCVEKHYNLNYRCTKFCLTLLPDYVNKGAVAIKYFSDEKIKSEPFFYFKNNAVNLA